MLKTKYALSAFCMLVAMTMATSAFAQGVFSVSSSIEPRARMNGQTEAAGGITLSLESGTITGADEEGIVVINYGTTITNVVGTMAQAEAGMSVITVDICGESGAEGMGGNIVRSGSALTITVDGDAGTGQGCNNAETINVEGVRLAIAGQGLTGVAANITSSGDVRLGSGANEVTVINSVVDELVDGGVTSDTVTLIRHTAAPEDNAYFKLLIEENAVDSFNGAALNLDFSGIGAGMSVTIDAWVTTKDDLDDLEPVDFVIVDDDPDTVGAGNDESAGNVLSNSQLALSGGDMTDTLTQRLTAMSTEAQVLMDLGNVFAEDDEDTTDVNEMTEVMGGSLSDTEIDVVVIRGKISVDTNPRSPNRVSLPLGDLDISATVDVGPTGPATYSQFHRGARPIPRFASDVTAAVTVIDVESDKTELVAPYALANGVFDTGFAISNMTTKPGQSGAITFTLYQTGEEPVTYTTSDMLDAGGTMAILLSEILLESEGVETFQGYVEITTDFTGADGIAYISDWAAFSATATLKVK
jgi:hypothetical protein